MSVEDHSLPVRRAPAAGERVPNLPGDLSRPTPESETI